MTPAESHALEQVRVAQVRYIQELRSQLAQARAEVLAARMDAVTARKMRRFAERMLAHDASQEERVYSANCLAIAVLKEIPAPGPVAVPSPVVSVLKEKDAC
jgi:hypothetical protein